MCTYFNFELLLDKNNEKKIFAKLLTQRSMSVTKQHNQFCNNFYVFLLVARYFLA